MCSLKNNLNVLLLRTQQTIKTQSRYQKIKLRSVCALKSNQVSHYGQFSDKKFQMKSFLIHIIIY